MAVAGHDYELGTVTALTLAPGQTQGVGALDDALFILTIAGPKG